MYDQIQLTVESGIATILWDRPEVVNAMSRPMLQETRHALKACDADGDVKVIILKGAGKSFSTGGDFGEGAPRSDQGVPENQDVAAYMFEVREVMQEWYQDYIRFSEMAKPVIAQVHGWCLGGAAWISVAADVTIVSEDTVFGQPEVRQGQPAGLIWALTAGWKNAMRYSLTGDHIDAAEALRIGLVNEVVPLESLDGRVRTLATRIAQLPLESIVMNKQMIRRGMDVIGFRSALLFAADQSAWLYGAWRRDVDGVFDRITYKEGISAAVRRRDAPFKPEPFGPHSKLRDEREQVDDKKEVTKLIGRFARAFAAVDPSALDDLWDHSYELPVYQPEEIADPLLASGAIKEYFADLPNVIKGVYDIEPKELAVDVFGDVAHAFARSFARLEFAKQAPGLVGDVRQSWVLRKTAGEWKFIHYHESRLTPGLGGGRAMRGEYETLDKFWSRVNARDLDTAMSLYSEDATASFSGRPAKGRNEIAAVLKDFIVGFPDIEFETSNRWTDGDVVVEEWRAHGTHQADFLGKPATGKRVSLEAVTIYRFSEGLIVDDRTYMDDAALLLRTGVLAKG